MKNDYEKRFIPSENIEQVTFKSNKDNETFKVNYDKIKQKGSMIIYDKKGYQIDYKDIPANTNEWVKYLEIIDRDKGKKIIDYRIR